MSTPRRTRADKELVRRGLARSREHAAELITAGLVTAAGQVVAKPATAVGVDTPLAVAENVGPQYVSRGGHKLAGALDHFAVDIWAPFAAKPDSSEVELSGLAAKGGLTGAATPAAAPAPTPAPTPAGSGLTVANRWCLDAGASTGGFTDVLLRRGAAGVIAVDVGYGQLAWPIRTDPKVTVLERTNVRTLSVDQLPYRPELVVADLSFISLRLVLPALLTCAAEGADLLVMVKPQFEVGREQLPDGGVVRDTGLRGQAVRAVAEAAWEHGYGTKGVVASVLPGPAGNVEYFLWLNAHAAPLEAADLDRALREGPQ